MARSLSDGAVTEGAQCVPLPGGKCFLASRPSVGTPRRGTWAEESQPPSAGGSQAGGWPDPVSAAVKVRQWLGRKDARSRQGQSWRLGAWDKAGAQGLLTVTRAEGAGDLRPDGGGRLKSHRSSLSPVCPGLGFQRLRKEDGAPQGARGGGDRVPQGPCPQGSQEAQGCGAGFTEVCASQRPGAALTLWSSSPGWGGSLTAPPWRELRRWTSWVQPSPSPSGYVGQTHGSTSLSLSFLL